MAPVTISRPPSERMPSWQGQDRRASPRQEPGERRIWLGWWADAENFRVIGAVLLDVSRGGVAVAADLALDPGEPVWLRLEAPDSTECVATRVVGVSRSSRGPHVIRMAFQTPCPARFFRRAMQGAAAPGNGAGQSAGHRGSELPGGH